MSKIYKIINGILEFLKSFKITLEASPRFKWAFHFWSVDATQMTSLKAFGILCDLFPFRLFQNFTIWFRG